MINDLNERLSPFIWLTNRKTRWKIPCCQDSFSVRENDMNDILRITVTWMTVDCSTTSKSLSRLMFSRYSNWWQWLGGGRFGADKADDMCGRKLRAWNSSLYLISAANFQASTLEHLVTKITSQNPIWPEDLFKTIRTSWYVIRKDYQPIWW